MPITAYLTRDEIHDYIFDWYDALDDVPPHPLPVFEDSLDDLMLILGGTDPIIEKMNEDGEILELRFTCSLEDWAQRSIALRTRQLMQEGGRAGAEKTNKNYTKKKRQEAAKKAWKKRRNNRTS